MSIATSLSERVVSYLRDAHAIEEQALVQMKRAPELAAAVPELAEAFEQHRDETVGHLELVKQRLQACDAEPSTVRNVVMKAGGMGFVLFAAWQPDTPGKLTAHAYSYEHLEVAAYELLGCVAERAHDTDTVAMAGEIEREERAMAQRLATLFDRTADASVAGEDEREDPDAMERRLVQYLTDAHALEQQSTVLLKRAPAIAGDAHLRQLYEDHLEETRGQADVISQRLLAHDAKRSLLQDAAMRLGAINWGLFLQAQKDTPGKLAAFAYAFEHLEIAGHCQLRRIAERAQDHLTVEAVERIVEQERAMAGRLEDAFDTAAVASLDAYAAPHSAEDAVHEGGPARG